MRKITLLLTAVFVLSAASIHAQQRVSRDGLGQLLHLMYFDHVPENEFNQVFQDFMKSNYPGQNILNPAEVREITSNFVLSILFDDAITVKWEKYADAVKAKEAEQQAAARQKSKPTAQQQQALDEIARIEKFNAQVDEMLRQAWEAGRTQTETVIDTPYGKVTVKFNLAEIINNNYTGSSRDFHLRNWHGSMGGNELRLNTSSWAFKNNNQLKIKQVIAHELGHHIVDRNTSVAPPGQYRTVSDLSEINADAFAMRHMGKTDSITVLKGDSSSQDYIDAVIKRAEEMEREDRENLNRLRNIASLQPQN